MRVEGGRRHSVIAVVGERGPLMSEAIQRTREQGDEAIVLELAEAFTELSRVPEGHREQFLSELISAAISTQSRLDGMVFLLPENSPCPASIDGLPHWKTAKRALETLIAANLAACDVMQVSGGCGSIVNVIPVWAVKGVVAHSFDSAASAGALGFTRALGVEWAQAGVRVNAVLTLPQEAADQTQWRPARIPNRRPPDPPEIWNVVEYLMSPEAKYVTAEALPADGGWLAYDYL